MIDYYLLTKPGIIIGNLVTFAAGFLLASRTEIHFELFFTTLLGLALIIASACVLNNYIDRDVDSKMKRTQKRAFACGKIKVRNALLFALLLGILGNAILYIFTNALTVAVANVGFFVYVLLYSLLKCHTTYSTLIGSIAGAIPPVVGYCAVSGRFDLAAAILFTILIFWQMPHFFAISVWHLEDYARAEIPVLPVAKGVKRAKIHMTLYVLGLIPVAGLLTFFEYTGYLFLTMTLSIGSLWLFLCIRGFRAKSNRKWGRQMFQLSLVMISVMCLLISFKF